MKQFLVKFVNATGKYQQELIQAQSFQDCERIIKDHNGTFVSAQITTVQSKTYLQSLNLEDLLEFSSVIYSLLIASLSIRDALTMVSMVSQRNKVAAFAKSLINFIDKGETLSSAFLNASASLPPIIIALITIGEKTGNLAMSFELIIQYLERRHKVISSLKSALWYPLMVFILLVVGSIAISIYVFPKFNALFAAMGNSATQELQNTFYNMRIAILGTSLFLSGITITFLLLKVISNKNPKTKRALDTFVLRIPVINKYIFDINTLDFVFSMEALINSGIPLNDALSESLKSFSNSEYASMVEKTKQAIIKGFPLSAAFESEKRFPIPLIMWIKIGERSGNVSAVFSQLRLYYEEKVNKNISVFVRLIEPAMNVIIGIIMLVIIFTVIIPFFNVYGTIIQ